MWLMEPLEWLLEYETLLMNCLLLHCFLAAITWSAKGVPSKIAVNPICDGNYAFNESLFTLKRQTKNRN